MNAFQRQGYRTDAMVLFGAAANRRAFPGPQKRYMRARQVSKTTASRHMKGDVHAASTRLLIDAAKADGATAFPYLAEVQAVINQMQIRATATDVLVARLRELNELEHDADANEDRHAMRVVERPTRDQRMAAAEADVRAGELLLERAAIQRELATRGV